MTTARIFAQLRALPETVNERQVTRVLMKAMAARLFLGVVALGAWYWITWRYVQLEPRILERLLLHAGSLAVFLATVYPLIRITRMTDEECERLFNAEASYERRQQ